MADLPDVPPAPPVPPVAGFAFATAAARIKDWNRDDLALAVATGGPASAAGVFTQSALAAAPVKRCRAWLARTGGRARAVLVNAGAANACTGRQGMADADACARRVAGALGVRKEEVLLASTGVIGRPLPMDRMAAGTDAALGRLEAGQPLEDFARAIMTTDTFPKAAWAKAGKGARAPVVAGACKGSGMIAPNMATMLAFLFTDAAVSPPVLKKALVHTANLSFNNVTVDGDTSTNDTLLALASGARGGGAVSRASGPAYAALVDALSEVSLSLATQIARDGEGATKLVHVRVSGAATEADARKAARTIAESPLVKTALFGNDPNWGRVLMAIGRSGARVREGKIGVSLCGTPVMKAGQPLPFDGAAVSARMKRKEAALEVSLGSGKGQCAMLTCDYSYDYIRINADYTT